MHWVIQDNMYNEEGFHKLISALERLNLPHTVHKVVPFIRRLVPDVDPSGAVVVMGSYTMSHIAADKCWRPGSFMSGLLDYKIQLRHWGDHMLNSDAEFSRFDSVAAQLTPFFIRPVQDNKFFCGMVTDFPAYIEWRDNVLDLWEGPVTDALCVSTPVMVCKPKKIYRETRVWIVEGKAVTASNYKVGTRVTTAGPVDPYVLHFAEKRAQEWSPVGAYCMDIADTPEGIKIIECGNLSACGFYDADMTKLVMALEKSFGA